MIKLDHCFGFALRIGDHMCMPQRVDESNQSWLCFNVDGRIDCGLKKGFDETSIAARRTAQVAIRPRATIPCGD